MEVMGLLSWIVFGLIAGALAKFVMPGNDPGGCIVTIIIGVVGAVARRLPRHPARLWRDLGVRPPQPRGRRHRVAPAPDHLADGPGTAEVAEVDDRRACPRRCAASGRISFSMASATALGEPGRRKTALPPIMPAAARLEHRRRPHLLVGEHPEQLPEPLDRPGRRAAETASTVTSRGENPVPPVATTTSTSGSARNRCTAPRMASTSSGTRVESTIR